MHTQKVDKETHAKIFPTKRINTTICARKSVATNTKYTYSYILYICLFIHVIHSLAVCTPPDYYTAMP